MIFFLVWLRVCSREVLRELFQLPKNVYYKRNFSKFSGFSCRLSLDCWAFGFDLFPPSYPTQRAKAKNSNNSIAPLPPLWLGFWL